MRNKSLVLAASVASIFFIVLVPVLLRARANTVVVAESPGALWWAVFEQQKAVIEQQIDPGLSAGISPTESSERWQHFRELMVEAGSTPEEAKAVVATAKDFLPTGSAGMPRPHWPVLVKRGYVKSAPMWVFITLAEGHKTAITKGWRYWICVIDPQKPQLLADNHVLPR